MRALAEEIKNVPVPDFDPVFGANGPLSRIWKSKLAGYRAKI